jgi:predicted dehydrogenase
MINVGIVGVGFMGMIHYLAYQRLRGIRVSAIATRNREKREGDWRSIQGNFGPPGQKMKLDQIARYQSLDEMLKDERLDAIDICSPPNLHATMAVRAMRSGKHVFCEKPIALTLADAERMLKAAGTHRRMLLVGHVLPFFPEFNYVVQVVRSRRYGKLLGGHFKRIISDPKWLKDYYNPHQVGGPAVDLHVHDAHFIRVLFGMPVSVNSVGRMRGDVAEFFSTQFRFADQSLSVTADSGVIHQQGRAFTHGFEIHLQKATLLFDFSVLGNQPTVSMPLTVLTANGRTFRPKLGSGDPVDGFVAELREVARALKQGKDSKFLSGELARDALLMCHRQTRSVVSRRSVRV